MLRRLAALALAPTLVLGGAALLPAGPAPASASASEASARTTAARTTAARTTSGPVFSRPGDDRIHDLVLSHIRGTPSGAWIRAASWSWTSDEIAAALQAADDRGVVVRVLTSPTSVGDPALDDLRARLGSDCSGERSCFRVARGSTRGTDRFDGAGTSMHQKSWTFSTTGSLSRVTVITSHNATDGARDWQYNTAQQFVGNLAVYNAVRDVFAEQLRDDAEKRPWLVRKFGSTTALYFSPWNNPTMDDPVVRRIRSLPERDLVVRVATSAWYGPRGNAIARALAAKKRAGAGVFVLAGDPTGAEVLRILRGAGIPVRLAPSSDTDYSHLKFMTARWRDGDRLVSRVWSGSENWSGPSRGSDELVVKVGAGRWHGDYVRFFDSLFNR